VSRSRPERIWNSYAFGVAVFVVYCALLVGFAWNAITKAKSGHWPLAAVDVGVGLFMVWRIAGVVRRRGWSAIDSD